MTPNSSSTNNNIGSVTPVSPVAVYPNACKSQILKDNKGKSGVYC